MKTVTIVESFTGYPSGKKRAFSKGEEAEVPDAFADLIVGKGHAREKPAQVVEAPPARDPAPEITTPKKDARK